MSGPVVVYKNKEMEFDNICISGSIKKRVFLIRRQKYYEGKYFATYREQIDNDNIPKYFIDEYSNGFSENKTYEAYGCVLIRNNKVIGWWKNTNSEWREINNAKRKENYIREHNHKAGTYKFYSKGQ